MQDKPQVYQIVMVQKAVIQHLLQSHQQVAVAVVMMTLQILQEAETVAQAVVQVAVQTQIIQQVLETLHQFLHLKVIMVALLHLQMAKEIKAQVAVVQLK